MVEQIKANENDQPREKREDEAGLFFEWQTMRQRDRVVSILNHRNHKQIVWSLLGIHWGEQNLHKTLARLLESNEALMQMLITWVRVPILTFIIVMGKAGVHNGVYSTLIVRMDSITV